MIARRLRSIAAQLRGFECESPVQAPHVDKDVQAPEKVNVEKWPWMLAPPMPIETNADVSSQQELIGLTDRVWSNYGNTDPYFSVLTNPKYHGIPSEEVLCEFYSTGELTLKATLSTMIRAGLDPKRFRTILDFGCGVGCVSYWFCKEFERVIGVDISQRHLDLAASHIKAAGLANFVPVRLEGIEGLGQIPGYDALFTEIVLQHNPPPIMKLLLGRLLDQLSPGGFAIVQIPTYHDGYRYSVAEHLAQKDTIQLMEVHAPPQRTVFHVIERSGCKVIEVFAGMDVGPGWLSQTFVLLKPTV
jgi:SAM-dependent methyltransferase